MNPKKIQIESPYGDSFTEQSCQIPQAKPNEMTCESEKTPDETSGSPLDSMKLRWWKHDVNNALTPIGPALELAHEISHEPEVRTTLKKALTSMERLNRLFKLLDGCLKNNVQQTVPECATQEVIEHTLDNFAALLPAQVLLSQSLSQSLWPTTLSAVVVESILYNLLENARDASVQKGGIVTVGAYNATLGNNMVGAQGSIVAAGRYVVVSVADAGTGIEPAVEKRLFEAYFTTKPPGKGTGIGLASVKALLAHGGGGISYRTRYDYGSCFSVYLPVKAGDR